MKKQKKIKDFLCIRNKFRKKAQIKSFETIAILFIFFILVGLGFIFYGFIHQSSMAQQYEETAVLRGVEIVESIVYLPEIQCSFDNIEELNCIDLYKLEAAREKINENNEFYYPIFGNSKVTLTQIFPEKKESIILYDRSKTKSEKQETHIPISIYHPGKEQYYYGILKVEVYM